MQYRIIEENLDHIKAEPDYLLSAKFDTIAAARAYVQKLKELEGGSFFIVREGD